LIRVTITSARFTQEQISHIFREAMDHFLKLGFRIALDDTGVGYASLEAALELSPDYLKVDLSLIRGVDTNPQKQALLEGLQNIAARMGA
jgi:EAL domain-containing protein (putative c-di-GMP-specific phosphodiesterase class I)